MPPTTTPARFSILFALALSLAGCSREFRQRRVEFAAEGGPKLSGTLYEPLAPGPHAALVMIGDGGPLDRDGNARLRALLPHADPRALSVPHSFPIYRRIAQRLAGDGVGVLLYDKRGTGRSEGDWIGAGFKELAADANAARDFLHAQPDVDPKRVGVCGHGQGGYVASISAANHPGAAFLVLLAAPAVFVEQQMVTQVDQEMRAEGFSQRETTAALEFSYRALAAIQTKNSKELDRLLGDARQKDWAYLLPPLTSDDLMKYLRPLLGYEPTPVLSRVKVPLLAIYGGYDCAVPPPRNAMRLDEILRKAGHADFTINILPGANHHFLAAKTGSRSEWRLLPREFDAGFLDLLSDWLKRAAP